MYSKKDAKADLVWRLGDGVFEESELGFLDRLESTLCIFSPSVGQLYSSYDLCPGYGDQGEMISMPVANAGHDTFCNIPAGAVEPTAYFIIPDSTGGDGRLRLAYQSKQTGRLKASPLSLGMERLQKISASQDPFLPVIVCEDLKKLELGVPIMPLHKIKLSRLEQLSSLQRGAISATIQNKMEMLVV